MRSSINNVDIGGGGDIIEKKLKGETREKIMNMKTIKSNEFVILKGAIHKRCHNIQGGGSKIDKKFKVTD